MILVDFVQQIILVADFARNMDMYQVNIGLWVNSAYIWCICILQEDGFDDMMHSYVKFTFRREIYYVSIS